MFFLDDEEILETALYVTHKQAKAWLCIDPDGEAYVMIDHDRPVFDEASKKWNAGFVYEDPVFTIDDLSYEKSRKSCWNITGKDPQSIIDKFEARYDKDDE